MTADTPRHRIFLVRLALGDGIRSPMPMADFAALLTRSGTVRYDSSTISKIENGARRITLDDAAIIASVDPMQRGLDWLAARDAKTPTPIEVGGQVFNPDPTLDYKVTDEEHAADEAEYQAQQAAKARPRPKQA